MDVQIKGTIIPNDQKSMYNFFEIESTCLSDVTQAISAAAENERIDVYINSGGGDINAATEISALIRRTPNVRLHVTGEACSAATIIMCSGDCDISPTSLVMIHNTATSAYGSHAEMEHTAEILKTADMAVCSAYVDKTGKPADHWLALMEQEKWFTAQEVVDLGLCDRIAPSVNNGRCRILTAQDRIAYETARAKAEAQLKLERIKMR